MSGRDACAVTAWEHPSNVDAWMPLAVERLPLSLHFQEQLLHGPQVEWRRALASNPYLDRQVLVRLGTFDDEVLQQRIASSASLPESLQRRCMASRMFLVPEMLAENPSLLPSLQVELASQADRAVRRALAKNERLTSQAALILAADGRADVSYRLARNPALVWDTHLPAQFVHLHAPWRLEQWALPHPWNEVTTLATQWQGTTASLLEALDLTSRN